MKFSPSAILKRAAISRLKGYLAAETFVLTAAQLAYVGSSLLTTIAAGWWITPDELGLWRILSLAEAYAAFATFGIPSGFLRQHPIYQGAGRLEANTSRTRALYISQVTQAVVGLMIALHIARTYPTYRDSNWMVPVLLMYGLYFVLTRLKASAETFLRAESRFASLAKAYCVLAALRAGTLIFIPIWGFEGFLFRWPLSMLIEFLVLQRLTGLHWRTVVGFPSIRTIVQLSLDGVPSLLIAAVAAFADSLDRRWLSLYGTAHSVGIYFIADAVKMYCAQIFGSIALVQYTRCGFAYGLGDIPGMWRSLYSAVQWIVLAYLCSVVLLVAGLLFGVPWLLPRYASGVSAALVIIVGSAGMVAASLGFPLTVTRNYSWILGACCCGLGTQILAQTILAKRMHAETMVAVCWSIGQIVNGIVMVVGVLWVLRRQTAAKAI